MRTKYLVALALPCLAAAPALAWRTETCDGSVVGYRHPVTFRLNRCSIPEGSARESDVTTSMYVWNVIQGMEDMFSSTSGSAACSITEGNDIDEIGYVSRDAIDGAAGLTNSVRNRCGALFGNGATTEADVYIASDLKLGAIPMDASSAVGSRHTILHEFGHVLGMKHEDEGNWPRLMHSYGLASWVWAGPLSTSVHPDDVDFGLTYHTDDAAEKLDLAVSNFEMLTNTSIIGTFPGTSELCPGQDFTYTFSVGNLGGIGISSANKAKVNVVISDDSTIGDADDVTVAGWWVWLSQGAHTTVEDATFAVPSWLVSGKTYYVGINVDPADTHDELFETTNNRVYLAKRLKRKSGC